MFHEAEMAKRQADAMKGHKEPEIPSIFQSNEVGQFAPTPDDLRDGYRYNGENTPWQKFNLPDEVQ